MRSQGGRDLAGLPRRPTDEVLAVPEAVGGTAEGPEPVELTRGRR
ncbi:hypothetical protein [Streptomyces anulatus]|nr:hypothetical protein OG238_33920 [Streptomyces anulatus]